jgi:transcription elongation factor Elf1
MGERNANIGPRFYGSVAALCPDDILTFACPVCGHQASMEARALTERVSGTLLIEDIDARLRCTRCGARGQAQLIAIDAAEQ